MNGTPILDGGNCQKVLETYLKASNFQLKSFQVSNFRNPMQGLVGEHFTLRIEYTHNNEEKTEEFFVKTLSTNPFMFNFSKTILVYEKETFFYQLLKEYEKYNIDTSFAPKGFFFKPYITVLEYLPEEYKGTPKRQLLDLDHCQGCLEAIAKFHGANIIYEKRKENEFGRKFSLLDDNINVLEDKLQSKEENIVTRWMMASVRGLFDLIDLIPENHITHNEFKNTLSQVLSVGSVDGLLTGLSHGDLWTSNFLHSYKDGKPVDTKLLDFQLIKYGPLEQDITEFLMTNTTRAFRRENFENLVKYYYKKLKNIIIGGGINHHEILPAENDFVRSCNSFKLAGKVHAIVDHSYTFVADEIYGDALKTEESFRKFLFEERGKCIVDSYNKNDEFKKVLREDVLELRDLLFA